jgi:demethylmenaquinone methyltransferase/2-methoxy-6-polyprenyl-1,4-benzoquinol methylase
MTFRTESRMTIASGIHEVFAYLCDVGRWPEWAPTVLEGRVRGGGPLQPGSRVDQRAKLMFGLSRNRSQGVTVVEPPTTLAFAGPMGTSAARWGMELKPVGDGQTNAMMWVEVDFAGIMLAIPAGMLKGRVQRVSDIEMEAIKAAVESDAGKGARPDTGRPDAAGVDEPPVSQTDSTRQYLIDVYRKKAKHYDITSRLYPVPGYPQRAQRLRTVQALGLRAGDTVIDMACGTGLNFPLLQKAVGPGGRIVGVDLTDAMLARAQDRIKANGWSNVSLVQADAVGFDFPARVDAILSTYALTQVPECADVIAHGTAALSAGGRWAVLDLKVPGSTPGWLAQLGAATVRPFAAIDQWIMRRPWEAIRTAMQEELADFAWTELFFGTAFLAAGSSQSGRDRAPRQP